MSTKSDVNVSLILTLLTPQVLTLVHIAVYILYTYFNMSHEKIKGPAILSCSWVKRFPFETSIGCSLIGD